MADSTKTTGHTPGPCRDHIHGLVSLALAYAAGYQSQHGLEQMHPAHQEVLRPFLSDAACERLGFQEPKEPNNAD